MLVNPLALTVTWHMPAQKQWSRMNLDDFILSTICIVQLIPAWVIIMVFVIYSSIKLPLFMCALPPFVLANSAPSILCSTATISAMLGNGGDWNFAKLKCTTYWA